MRGALAQRASVQEKGGVSVHELLYAKGVFREGGVVWMIPVWGLSSGSRRFSERSERPSPESHGVVMHLMHRLPRQGGRRGSPRSPHRVQHAPEALQTLRPGANF